MFQGLALGIGIPALFFGAAIGIPVGLIAIHDHGINQGVNQERTKLVERGYGRYVFMADTGKPAFAYGKGQVGSWIIEK